jgi:peptide/nickel transport system ATP-binding protein
MVFQDPYGALNPRRNVGQILRRAGILGGLSASEAQAQALALLDMVGLPREALLRGVDAFSGGQRQRVGIARALAMRPSLIIADEIVAALDMSMQAQILDLLARLKRDTGLTLLFITHDLRVAADIADTVAVMHKGRIVEMGPVPEVFASPSHDYTRQLLDAIPGQALRGTVRTMA